jgi:translation initiation factor IF-2
MQADASGTVEAVKAALAALPQDSVLLRFLVAVPNNITTSDIDLAAASEALVVGFNAEPSEEVAAAAKERGERPSSSRC